MLSVSQTKYSESPACVQFFEIVLIEQLEVKSIKIVDRIIFITPPYVISNSMKLAKAVVKRFCVVPLA